MANSDSAYPVTLTAAGGNGEERFGFMGWSNHNIDYGGDFGITIAAPNDNLWQLGGFDHHNPDHWMLNNNCVQQILYSHSRPDPDGDAGYDSKRTFGLW